MATVDIIARLKLVGEQFTREFGSKMDDVEKKAKAASSRISGAFNTIKPIAFLAGGAALGGLAVAARQALEYADNLSTVADQAGINVERYQTLREATRALEIDGDKFDQGLKRLNDTLGDVQNKVENGATKALDRMGISQRILSGEIKTADQLLDAIAGTADRYGESTRFTSDVVEIFGRKVGVDMAAALRDGGTALHQLEADMRASGTVIDEQMIQKLADANETIEKFQERASRDFTIFLGDLVQTFEDAGYRIDLFQQKLAQLSPLGHPENYQGAIDDYERRNIETLHQKQRWTVASAKGNYNAAIYARDHGGTLDQLGKGSAPAIAQRKREMDEAAAELERLTGIYVDVHSRAKPATSAPSGPPVATAETGGGSRARAGKSDAERAAEQAEQAQKRLTAALQDTLKAQGDSLKFAQMRVMGLGKEADLEERLSGLRNRYADDIAKAKPAEQAVTPELAAQLKLYEQQVAAVGDLIAKGTDVSAMTDQQKAGLQGSLDALNATDAAAAKVAVTLKDQLLLSEARLRAEHGITVAQQDQADAQEKARDRARRLGEIEQSVQEALEEQRRRAEDQMLSLADFYEDALHGGTKSIWENFKDEGKRAIAVIAAKWTMALLSGQQVSLPGILSDLSGMPGGMGGGGLLNALGSLIGPRGGAVRHVGTYGADSGEGLSGSPAPRGPVWGQPGHEGGMPWDGQPDVFAGNSGGMMAGVAVGSLIGPQLGKFITKKGSAVGGGVGAAAGTAIGMALGGPLGAAVGSMIGSMIGSMLGGALKATKKGTASLTLNEFGDLGVGATTGNSNKRIAAASSGIGSVAEILSRVADQLGGQITGNPSVSLAVREGSWRLDPTGRGMTKIKNGAIDFGEDQEAAVRAAVVEALKDGVIGGISQASKNILASGQDLEKAITKAAMIEEIPKLLRARLDPVGAALDELNAKWAKTVAALREGGASAEQMADAQKLYKLELEDTRASTREASASLKDFLKSLAMGPDSPYSLTQQQQRAAAELQPFLDKINAGEGIDQAKYQEAAQSFLDIERQLFGSTGKFFEAMDMVQAATGKAIATIDNAAPIRTAADPFAQKTADNTTAMAGILDQQSMLLAQIRDGIARMGGINGGGGGFIGTDAMYLRKRV